MFSSTTSSYITGNDKKLEHPKEYVEKHESVKEKDIHVVAIFVQFSIFEMMIFEIFIGVKIQVVLFATLIF